MKKNSQSLNQFALAKNCFCTGSFAGVGSASLLLRDVSFSVGDGIRFLNGMEDFKSASDGFFLFAGDRFFNGMEIPTGDEAVKFLFDAPPSRSSRSISCSSSSCSFCQRGKSSSTYQTFEMSSLKFGGTSSFGRGRFFPVLFSLFDLPFFIRRVKLGRFDDSDL